jgi:hypothetical protein
MIVQHRLLAAIRNGVKVEREARCVRKQVRRQLLHPALQQPFLVAPLGAIRVVGGEALLGQDVQAGEESQGFVAVEVVDVAAAFFVQQLKSLSKNRLNAVISSWPDERSNDGEPIDACHGGQNHENLRLLQEVENA